VIYIFRWRRMDQTILEFTKTLPQEPARERGAAKVSRRIAEVSKRMHIRDSSSRSKMTNYSLDEIINRSPFYRELWSTLKTPRQK
jgi:hypothetical protein